jgi:hypothetical protein
MAKWYNLPTKDHSLVADRFEASYSQLCHKIDSSHCHLNLRQHK